MESKLFMKSFVVIWIGCSLLLQTVGCKHQAPPTPLPGSGNGGVPGGSYPLRIMNVTYTYMLKGEGGKYEIFDNPPGKTRVRKTIYDAFAEGNTRTNLIFWNNPRPESSLFGNTNISAYGDSLKRLMGNPSMVFLEAKEFFPDVPSAMPWGATKGDPVHPPRALRNSWSMIFVQSIYDHCSANPEAYTPHDTSVWNQLGGQVCVHELGHQRSALTEQNLSPSWHEPNFWCVMHQADTIVNGHFVQKSKFCAACKESLRIETSTP